jgi:hypothetical protein
MSTASRSRSTRRSPRRLQIYERVFRQARAFLARTPPGKKRGKPGRAACPALPCAMATSRRLMVSVLIVPLASCASVGVMDGDRLRDGPLSRTEIERCLLVPHRVGDRTILPTPRPGYVFKPGYNFSVKEPDGSYGFGYHRALNGRLIIRYPAQNTTVALDVVRRNGVVYFGKDATSCR